MSDYNKKSERLYMMAGRKFFLFLFIGSLLFTISCTQKKSFSELLKEKSDSLNLLKTTYNANYFKDSVNMHFLLRANYMSGKIEILPPVYRVPGKFFNVYQDAGDFEIKLLNGAHAVIHSYRTLPPNLTIAHESDNDTIIHTIESVPFNVSFPADANIKYIGFNQLKTGVDTTIGIPDTIAVIQ